MVTPIVLRTHINIKATVTAFWTRVQKVWLGIFARTQITLWARRRYEVNCRRDSINHKINEIRVTGCCWDSTRTFIAIDLFGWKYANMLVTFRKRAHFWEIFYKNNWVQEFSKVMQTLDWALHNYLDFSEPSSCLDQRGYVEPCNHGLPLLSNICKLGRLISVG